MEKVEKVLVRVSGEGGCPRSRRTRRVKKFKVGCRQYETPLHPGAKGLPDGAWAEWGKDAVYFVAKSDNRRSNAVVPGMRGLTIYVINPTDDSLPVYRLFDFSFHEDNRINIVSAAVVDSRAYVVGDGHIWVRDIGCDMGWQDGPQFSCAPPGIGPDLFVVGGKLFAIRFKETGMLEQELFEVLVDGIWRSLPRPPPLCRTEDNPSCLSVNGFSCIGDHRRVIFHVASAYDGGPPRHKDSFLCFQASDDFQSGHWTWLNHSACGFDYAFPAKHRPVHSSHLCSGDALVLPALPTGILASVFGFAAAPVDNLLEFKIMPETSLWDIPEERHSPCPSQLHWHLISMGGSRYCAIAFPSRLSLDVTVWTFGRDVTGSLKHHRVQNHELGVQTRPTLMLSGRAYSGSTTT